MIVAVTGDAVSISVDTGTDGYGGPDVLDDLCRRARELYRLSLHDHLDELGDHACDTT